MNPRAFREYDIRGVADRDLTDDVVRAIGLAIGERAKNLSIVVGRDCRLTSPRIFEALTAGLRAHAEVIDIGIVPTPVVYFAQQHLLPAAAIMITGSHNPAEDNGLKIMIGAETIYGDAIAALRDRVAQILTLPVPSPSRGMWNRSDVSGAYLDRANMSLRLGPRRTRIVLDAGNGSGGLVAFALYKKLGFDVIPIHCNFDGRFPNHHPDPTQPENLVDLIAAVKQAGAEVGIALDGDADRLGAVDATGRILWGDQLMILLGRVVLDEITGARFVGEVKCSQTMYDELSRGGGKIEMWKVGHSLIKKRMKETGAHLAGEMSGHLFFAHRWLGFDDGIYAGGRLLELLSWSEKKLDRIVSELPIACNTPEIRIACPDEEKVGIVERVATHLRVRSDVIDVVEIDGVRARFADGWGLVRASNTQPALVMRCEGSDEAALARIRAALEQAVAVARS